MDRLIALLHVILRPIRRMVYALGFDPPLGTILHSPSIVALKAGNRLMEQMIADYNQVVKEQPVLIKLPADRLGLSHIPITLKTVYASMRFCPMCGAELEDYIMDMKECPNGHGKAEPEDDRKGLPAIVFHPYSESQV